MRLMIALWGLAVLGACTTAQVSSELGAVRAQIENLDLLSDTRRAYDLAYRDLPFDGSTISLVAVEHGELHTYSLTPCGTGRICGGTGHVGRAALDGELIVVTGAYPDRTFYLRPGGDGTMLWRGEYRDLAWN